MTRIAGGDVSQEDVEQSLAACASGHIAKPLAKDRLTQLIAHALGECTLKLKPPL